MYYAIAFVVSYLIGNINPAIHIGRWRRNIDIRQINSKNAGTSNAVMTIGWRWGILVLLLDMLKGFVPALAAKLLFPDNDILWFTAGLGAILGHIYPVFHGFKGGKGSATFGGVLFGTVPLYAAGLLAVYILVLVITDYIALSTLVAIIATPIALYLMDYHLASILLMSVFSAISFYKHTENYKRLLKGEEVGIRKFSRNKDRLRVTK